MATQKKKPSAHAWRPGQSGNPAGKPPGSGELQKLRAAICEHVPEIINQLMAAAQGGDIQAARLILERVLPPMKATEQAVELDLPEGGTLTAKAAAVLSAAAAGVLAPGQAAQLISALGTVAKISEIDELASRVAALRRNNMQNLNKRIASLEQANPDNGFPKTIFITFLSLGDTKPDIRKLGCTHGDGGRQKWERGPNESEDDFKDHASKEVSRNAAGTAMLFMGE